MMTPEQLRAEWDKYLKYEKNAKHKCRSGYATGKKNKKQYVENVKKEHLSHKHK